MKAVLYGCGGHGRVVLDCCLSQGWDVLGFVDDDQNRRGEVLNGVQVLGKLSDCRDDLAAAGAGVVPAIGNNELRADCCRRIAAANLPLLSVVHSSAVISGFASLGDGTVVMPGVCVNANTTIGSGVILNTGCTVDHDCVVGNVVHIAPGAHLAGHVTIGDGAFLGVGVATIPFVEVGAHAVVGAGAAVVNSLPAHSVCVGVPARPKRERPQT